jgi:hypothetical protein
MCAKLKLEQFGYSRDTLCLPISAAHAGRDRLRRPILPRHEFDEAAGHLAQITRDYLTLERKSKCQTNDLYEAFMEMYDGEEVEVSNDTEATTNDIFANPTTLSTLSGLKAQTSKMIRAESWDSLLCTAESGEWLIREEGWSDEIESRNATLAVILADETHSDAIRTRFGSRLGNRARWLPWWLHNRHVTVLLREKRAVQAIYFERRLRTSHITPLWLEGPDAEIAMHAFVAYWIKAMQYEQFGREIEIRPDQVRLESERLVEDLYQQGRT